MLFNNIYSKFLIYLIHSLSISILYFIYFLLIKINYLFYIFLILYNYKLTYLFKVFFKFLI